VRALLLALIPALLVQLDTSRASDARPLDQIHPSCAGDPATSVAVPWRIGDDDAGPYVVAGDLAYADDAGGTEYEERWMANDLPIVAERWPVIVGWDNYRAFYVQSETITRYFQLPSDGRPNSCNPFPYHSFRYGGVHIAVLDSPVSPCFECPVQHAWLRDDPGRPAADHAVLWTVVLVHQLPFSSVCHGNRSLNRFPELNQWGLTW